MISRKIGISTKELEQALQLSRKILSFENSLNTGQLIGETIPEDRLLSPEQIVIAKERDQYVKSLISHLTETEISILQMRFGIGSNNRMTLKEIGDIFGLTRERIRQIESTSIKKLRLLAKDENFRGWLNV
jgi:RNA polymerase primary sigma factor